MADLNIFLLLCSFIISTSSFGATIDIQSLESLNTQAIKLFEGVTKAELENGQGLEKIKKYSKRDLNLLDQNIQLFLLSSEINTSVHETNEIKSIHPYIFYKIIESAHHSKVKLYKLKFQDIREGLESDNIKLKQTIRLFSRGIFFANYLLKQADVTYVNKKIEVHNTYGLADIDGFSLSVELRQDAGFYEIYDASYVSNFKTFINKAGCNWNIVPFEFHHNCKI